MKFLEEEEGIGKQNRQNKKYHERSSLLPEGLGRWASGFISLLLPSKFAGLLKQINISKPNDTLKKSIL